MALPRTPAYKLAAAKVKARAAVQQSHQDEKNYPQVKALAQHEQDRRNALAFPQFAAAMAAAQAKPPAAAPAAPAPVSPNGNVSAPEDIDPRDSAYGVGLAGLLGQVQSQRQAIAGEGAADQLGYDENLKTLAAQRGNSLDETKRASNQQGLLYSGILGKRNGEVNASYDAQELSNLNALTGRQADRTARLQQIGDLTADQSSPYGYSATGNAGMSLYSLLSSAADRRIAQMPNDALVPTTTPDAGPTPAVPLPPQSGNPTVKPKAVAKPKVKVKTAMAPFKQAGAYPAVSAKPFARTGSVMKGLR